MTPGHMLPRAYIQILLRDTCDGTIGRICAFINLYLLRLSHVGPGVLHFYWKDEAET